MPRTFTLKIDCDNAAFDDENLTPEVVRILREIADSIEELGVPTLFETIFDSNGNDVGRYALKQRPE